MIKKTPTGDWPFNHAERFVPWLRARAASAATGSNDPGNVTGSGTPFEFMIAALLGDEQPAT